MSLQADGKVAFEDIPVFGVCRPACHDPSLYLFVLVLFLEAVVLSQVHVAWDIFYQHIVHVYRGVVYNHLICLCEHDRAYSDIDVNQPKHIAGRPVFRYWSLTLKLQLILLVFLRAQRGGAFILYVQSLD